MNALHPGIGTCRFGAYVIEKRLGSGGFADVFQAVIEGDSTPLVIKIQETRDRHRALRFEREVEALRQLDHPAIPRLLDNGRIEDRQFLVTESHDARSLARIAQERGRQPAFRVTEVLQVLRSIGSALEQAHHLEIFHRDIKPTNVLIQDGFRPLLIDFGLSRIGNRTALTGKHDIVGTLHFCSPEMIESSLPLDGRSDQFQLATLAYWMLSGELPFPVDGGVRDLWNRFWTRPRSLVASNPEVPGSLAGVLDRALQLDPIRRFPAMRDFLEALPGDAARDPEDVSEVKRVEGGPLEWVLGVGARVRTLASRLSRLLIAC